VHISAKTLCGAPNLRALTVVFLGPQAYVGSGGGGEEVPRPYRAVGAGFEVSYRIPRTYVAGAQVGKSPTPVAVTPGAGYSFATYPAGGCTVRFTVTAR
jgi:hypothetical protein